MSATVRNYFWLVLNVSNEKLKGLQDQIHEQFVIIGVEENKEKCAANRKKVGFANMPGKDD